MPHKNNLKMNNKGNLRPVYPSRSFDKRSSYITAPATNLNATPMFYIGPRVNTLWSSTSPKALGVMKFGNINSMHNVYGKLYTGKGNEFQNMYPNLNVTVNKKGDYKIVDSFGKSHKIYSNSNGNYVKYNNKNVYL